MGNYLERFSAAVAKQCGVIAELLLEQVNQDPPDFTGCEYLEELRPFWSEMSTEARVLAYLLASERALCDVARWESSARD